MARNAMVNRMAAVAAVVAVAVAMSAGNAEARRAPASVQSSLGGASLWDRLADIGGRFTPIKVYGKAGWGDVRAAEPSMIRLRPRLVFRVRR